MFKTLPGVILTVSIGWTLNAWGASVYDESPYYDISHYFNQAHPFDTNSAPRPKAVAPAPRLAYPTAAPRGIMTAPFPGRPMPTAQAPWPQTPGGGPSPMTKPQPTSEANIDEVSGGVMSFEMANEDRGFLEDLFDPVFGALQDGNASGQLTWAFRFAYTPNKKNPDWFQTMRPFLFWLNDESDAKINYSLEGEAFTPRTWSKFVGRQYRPHVGLLTLNANVGLKGKMNGHLQRLDRVDLMVGVAGPASGMEKAHKGMHSLIGRNSSDWEQIKSEPVINLHLETGVRYFVFDPNSPVNIEIMPHIGAALGNAFTYGAAGLTARFGGNLDKDHGAPRLRYMLSGTNYPDTGKYFAWNFFAGIEGRAHVHNITLDGNTFTDSSHSVDKKRYTFDLQGGLEAGYGGYRATITNVFRSREFEGDVYDDMMIRLLLSSEL